MNNNKIKTVGILGGINSYATAMFFKDMLDLTPEKENRNQIRIIIDNNPNIRSCSRAILYGEESPVQDIIEMCKSLSSYPVDFIVIPSNNAVFFLSEVRKSIKTPILNIVDTAVDAFHSTYPRIKKVAVLGNLVIYLKEIYKNSLEKKGIQIYKYDKNVHRKVLNLIEELRLGRQTQLTQQHFNKIICNLKNSGVEGIILACAELTTLKDHDIELPLIDSNYSLVYETVKIALGEKVIPLDTENVYEFWRKRSRMLAAGEVSDYQSTLLTINPESAAQRDAIEKKKLLDAINKYRNRFNGLAIEYGCGVGRITQLLAEYFDRIDGIDYCNEFIDRARRNSAYKGINNVHYYACPIAEFVPKQKYDCVICSGIFEYQDENQFLKLVSLIANSLTASGVCLIRESVGVHKRFELHGFFSSVLDTAYNAIYRTSEDILNEFFKYGFSLIHEEMSLPPADGKPETCQKILILEKGKS